MLGIGLCARETKGGFAGEGDAPLLSTVEATILCEPHLFGVTAVEHFLDDLIIVGRVVSWVERFEVIPIIAENLLERILVDMFHGSSTNDYTSNAFSVGVIMLAGLTREKVPGVAGLSSFL